MSEHAWTETEPRLRVAGEVAAAPSVNTADMIRIPGGTFRMGSDKHYPEEAPAHRVTVSEFWIDRTPVTNQQLREFVKATGHVTFAEIPPDPKDYPGALPDMLFAGSLVFTPPKHPVGLRDSELHRRRRNGEAHDSRAKQELMMRMPGARSRRTSTPRTFLESTLDDMEGLDRSGSRRRAKQDDPAADSATRSSLITRLVLARRRPAACQPVCYSRCPVEICCDACSVGARWPDD